MTGHEKAFRAEHRANLITSFGIPISMIIEDVECQGTDVISFEVHQNVKLLNKIPFVSYL